MPSFQAISLLTKPKPYLLLYLPNYAEASNKLAGAQTAHLLHSVKATLLLA